MRNTEKSPPDRATRIRRMWRMFAIGAVLLVVSMLWAYAISAVSILPVRMLDGHLSLIVSVVYPLALGTLAAAGLGLAILRRLGQGSLLVALTCCAIAFVLIALIGRRAESPFQVQGGRVIYTVLKSDRPRSIFMPQTLGPVMSVEAIPVTILGPQSAMAVLPFLALPLILRWPAKKSAET